LEWQSIGLAPPEAVRVGTEQYLSDQDTMIHWIEEECDAEPGNDLKFETVSELYEAWCKYIRAQGGEPEGKIAFGDEMEAKGFRRDRTKTHGRVIRGIRLRRRMGGGNSA
jgi:putative DNA primase/helicase